MHSWAPWAAGKPTSPQERGDEVGYPVVDERRLQPVRRRLLLGGRREPGELPVLPVGGIYVFLVNGDYRPYGRDRHIDFADSNVVDAVAVSVVQMRPWSVVAELVIPSASAAD